MKLLAAASPVIKLLFERIGRPEIHNCPELLRPGGSGAVIVCNHDGWADGLWMSYAVYPRQLRHISKRELFASPITKWMLVQGGSISINRSNPSPSSIKSAVDLLRNGELLLIFPAGTRRENAAFKRGAATIALHAQVPVVPALYEGPRQMHVAHLLGRPSIRVTFGTPIPTDGLPTEKSTAAVLTERLQASIADLRAMAKDQPRAA